ncbi:hypothetical protein QBC34DRAFT_385660 [Podospora aff. communis PSN243]|uniref:Transmembrane protein n=1 Tax=Podospora aff. communis PSN243 TaxID=3040156 RepID=A0AAV9G7I6_9PEZI|nr:hypothetical protein QBC34DRAFT_385660 [Podospora aff. communis PSN243]
MSTKPTSSSSAPPRIVQVLESRQVSKAKVDNHPNPLDNAVSLTDLEEGSALAERDLVKKPSRSRTTDKGREELAGNDLRSKPEEKSKTVETKVVEGGSVGTGLTWPDVAAMLIRVVFVEHNYGWFVVIGFFLLIISVCVAILVLAARANISVGGLCDSKGGTRFGREG